MQLNELAIVLSLIFSAVAAISGLMTRATVAEMKNDVLKQVDDKYVPRRECNRIHGLIEDLTNGN